MCAYTYVYLTSKQSPPLNAAAEHSTKQLDKWFKPLIPNTRLCQTMSDYVPSDYMCMEIVFTVSPSAHLFVTSHQSRVCYFRWDREQ